MKKSNSNKIIGGILIVMVALITVFIIANMIESNIETDEPNNATDEPNNETTENETLTDTEYDDETLFYIGNSDMYEILNDQSNTGFFVYIGRPTCPHCRDFEPTLRETLRYLGQELRYFQTDLASTLNDQSEMTVSEILNALGVRGVPATVFIVNGEVVDELATSDRTQEGIAEFFEANGGLN